MFCKTLRICNDFAVSKSVQAAIRMVDLEYKDRMSTQMMVAVCSSKVADVFKAVEYLVFTLCPDLVRWCARMV